MQYAGIKNKFNSKIDKQKGQLDKAKGDADNAAKSKAKSGGSKNKMQDLGKKLFKGFGL